MEPTHWIIGRRTRVIRAAGLLLLAVITLSSLSACDEEPTAPFEASSSPHRGDAAAAPRPALGDTVERLGANVMLFAGRAVEKQRTDWAQERARAGDTGPLEALQRERQEIRLLTDSLARGMETRALGAAERVLLEEEIDGGSGTVVYINPTTFPSASILQHWLTVSVSGTQAQIVATAIYFGTHLTTGLTYSASHVNHALTYAPQSVSRTFLGDGVRSCTYLSCPLVSTSPFLLTLSNLVGCGMSVTASAQYRAFFSSDGLYTLQGISIPFGTWGYSELQKDPDVTASNATCIPPVAHFQMRSSIAFANDGGVLNLSVPKGTITGVSLDAGSNGGNAAIPGNVPITTYAWTVDGMGGGSGPGVSPALGVGTHSVVLTVTDQALNRSTATGTIVIVEESGTDTSGGTASGGEPWQPSPTPYQPPPTIGTSPTPGPTYSCTTLRIYVGGVLVSESTSCYNV